MPLFHLRPHPDFPSHAIHAITVDAERADAGVIDLEFVMHGRTDAVVWPDPVEPTFTDALWQHSCCEAFIGSADRPDYVELNIAMSTSWAAYGFDRYRAGMRRLTDLDPRSAMGMTSVQAMIRLSIDVPVAAGWPVWRLNLATIIAAKDGSKSYWALAHPPGKPDFHDRDCFTARLPAPTNA